MKNVICDLERFGNRKCDNKIEFYKFVRYYIDISHIRSMNMTPGYNSSSDAISYEEYMTIFIISQ
jgi:hypothetical protein